MELNTAQQTATDRLTPAQNKNGSGREAFWSNSPQADLWNYLKPEQKRVVRQIDDVVVGGIFGYLTTCYIRPLRINKSN